MRILILSLLMALVSGELAPQTGSLTGVIVDSSTGETLPGAMVVVDGTTKGTSTDFDGKFHLKDLPEGELAVSISYISYTTKKIGKIQIRNGEVTNVSVALEASTSQELQEVVIAVQLSRENNTALTLQQKNAAAVSDAISAESIRKTPDRNTGDVLRRVSGASIQDNKFAVIRGLSDRYNTANINGAPLPSTESDRKAFAFDIFPAMMLENLVVTKSATPDMPAEFAGGSINISTKSIPEEAFQSVAIGGSYHTLTTLKEFRTYKGGRFDWAGMDDGSRALPVGIPSTEEFERLNADQKAGLAKLMTPSWKIGSKTALPGLSLQYSGGNNFRLGGSEAGFIVAYNYLNSPTRNASVRREFEESETGVVQRAELRDEIYTNAILNSLMFNTAVKLNPRNQVSLKNLYSINSTDRVTLRDGIREMDNDPHQFELSSNRWFSQNRLLTSQLQGDHLAGDQKIKLKWVGSYSDVNNAIPNMRRIVYQKRAAEKSDTESPYIAVIQNNGTIPTAAGNMFWSNTLEKIYSLRYDAAMPFDFQTIKTELKIGGMQQFRNRAFNARNLGFSRYRKSTQPGAPFDNTLLTLPEEDIFVDSHVGLQENGLGGFKLEEATKVHDSYRASSLLHAAFMMIDSRIGEKFRIIAGARLESYRQMFRYKELGSNLDRNVDTTVTDLFPSVNLVYSLNQKSNLRASWYTTVSRPEFRELAPFQFYNFQVDNILSGSPHLKRALIRNADLRYEMFPGYGQLLSVSAFYKKFQDPIELFMRAGTSGAPELTYTNVPSATNYGMELEYRFRLVALAGNDSAGFLANTTVYTNLAFVKSHVDVSAITGANARPLQGQSPFLVNAGLSYESPGGGWQASLSYNLTGRRIFIVGNVQEPDVWENGRHVVDLQVGKTFRERLSVRFNIRDVLAQELLFYQNVESDERYSKGTDNRWQETTFGQSASIGISYRF